jgi:eukaryotic-like serine/threonine-protein kinase
MSPERWQQIEELFYAALELPTAERGTFLDRVCGGDAELRAEVEKLLAGHSQAAGFLDTPAPELVARKIAADSRAALAGRTLGHYRVLSQLGAGGMGEVYLAEDTRLSRRVAVKLLPARFTSDAERVRRFEQEARAASALNHPNILTIYEVGQASEAAGAASNFHYIVTEFVEGETLRERLRRSRLSVAEALDVAAQTAGALRAAHAAGIVHRDIKPENLMLRPDGYVKVLDFGLAKLIEAPPASLDTQTETRPQMTTESGIVLGTASYLSPEQARGQKADARADIFSLGVVLYEMAAGRRPFEGATAVEIVAAILHTEPPPLGTQAPDVPEALERAVGKALRKDRDARYQSVHELLADLKDLKQELEIAEKLRGRGQAFASGSGAQAAAAPALSTDDGEALTTAEGVDADTAAQRTQRTGRSQLRLSGARLAVLSASAAALIAAGWFAWRGVNARWAERQIPIIEKLAGQQRFFEAYDLALEAEKYLPADAPGRALLGRLRPRMSDALTVESEPTGASVYLKRAVRDAPRQLIGTTPISKLSIARGEYVLAVEKDGYAPFERAVSGALSRVGNALVPPDEPNSFKVKLVAAARLPARMSFVPGGAYKLVSRARPTDAGVRLDDFFIDRYEVTNREYKEFVTAGGYFKPEFWRHPFVKNGRALEWAEAVREFKDRTGLPGPRGWTNQNYPAGKAEHPVTDVTWHEAAAYAAFRGKRLPTIFEWEKAARNGVFTYYSGYVLPWGPVDFGGTVEGRANFTGAGTVPVESFEFGMSPFGCYQMAGNVSEWCLTEVSEGFTAAGGSWDDLLYVFTDLGAYPGFFSSDKLGFRCAKSAAGAADAVGDVRALRVDTSGRVPAYAPTSEASFKSMLSHFRYDRPPLAAEVVVRTETDEWRREKITYAGAHDERAIAYLYLPKSAPPPYQVLQFVPAGDVYGNYLTIAEAVEQQLVPYIKAGRAVWAVVFKGFRGREHPPGYVGPDWRSVRRREEVVGRATDLSRGLDYLSTRGDVDLGRLAFYGYSQGAEEGLMYVAVEGRYRAFVLVAGGLSATSDKWIAEASPPNFAAHIRVPKLMLSGRYDEASPFKTEIEPLFKLLREPKKMFVYDAGHTPPFEVVVPVVNGWLDETLGPVRRD